MSLTRFCERFLALVWLACSVVSIPASGSSVDPLLGSWVAVEKSNSGIRSTIELFLNDGEMHGRITGIWDHTGKPLDPTCERCTGVLQGSKVVGTVFIKGLKKVGNKWEQGTVVDLRPGPLQGMEARCEIQHIEGRAKITGHLLFKFLGGTDYWDPNVQP